MGTGNEFPPRAASHFEKILRAEIRSQSPFLCASDQSLLVYLDDHRHVRQFVRSLEMEPVTGVRNFFPAYHSVLIKFDPLKMSHDELQAALRSRLERLDDTPLPEPRRIEIPVEYDGPDLNDVAALHGMTPAQVVELHSSATYTVYFLGFVPGFAYLGGLPEALATPRLATPRRKVPPGSVGIGGNQCGVYPFATPGGWRLIGRTSLAMFENERSLLSIGDHVRFVPISK
jgi:inhibitor of KinA